MTPLQQALAKFKGPFRYDDDTQNIIDANYDEVIMPCAAASSIDQESWMQDTRAIGQAIADFLNSQTNKTK